MLGMLFETLLLVIIIGYIRKGKLSNLEDLPLKGWPLIAAGISVYFFQIFTLRFSNGDIANMVFNNLKWFQAASSIAIIAGLLISSRDTGYILSSLGMLLNMIASFVNGGRMPVSPAVLERLGLLEQLSVLQAGGTSVHQLMNETASLKFLCDVIPIPIVTPKAASIGDLILSTGIFLIIHKYMISSKALHS
jgi:hypothetical protein